jgi:tRNA(fMet)-specific endonuclease VapC
VDPRYLLDTNICIYIRQSRPPEVLKRFQKLRPGEAVLSVITFGELLYGAARSTKRAEAVARLEELRRLLPVLPLDESVADAYGAIRADLESRGERIGNNDLWIAAHSLATSLVLVTNNESEFSRVKGLKVQNWAA